MKNHQLASMRISTYLYGVITGRRTGLAPAFIRVVLTPLSWLYSITVRVRNGLYSSGIFKVKRLPCPVIGVGNIVAGGTGKTPTAIWIARHLQAEGLSCSGTAARLSTAKPDSNDSRLGWRSDSRLH